MTSMTSRQQVTRVVVRVAIVLLAYVVLRIIYSRVAGGRGLMSPSGNIDMTLVAAGLALWVTRTALIVVLPLHVMYRLTSIAARHCLSNRAK